MPDAAAHEPANDPSRGATRGAARDAARENAEQDSLFAHPAVAADATAAYGEHPDQVVDFYAPRGGGRGSVPLVVVLHGGAYRARVDRHHLSPFADFLARRGYAVASVEYRRGGVLPGQGDDGGEDNGAGAGAWAGTETPPAGRWPETFDDVAAALDALPALAAGALPEADTGRVVLVGHSAGGQLALWAAARHVLPQGAPWRLDGPAPLRGVVAIGPLADLGLAARLGVCEGALTQLLGEGDEFARRNELVDPALLLPTGIATTVVQGREDATVPYEVAESFVAAASRAGETVGLTLLEGVGHFPPLDPAADACAVVAEEIAQLAW
ncbi:alpha/beta hydrolase family protein [Streptomyces sp. 8L]|uniref:alpha/beta hydrolase family protein n=1 Tax=Streptomyces sp. 8L TaxID=2877242 RepID=UPI001CD77CD4|nr:alpha/beta hydrolase [Streptomyces sp. 8L]MCA1219562.1 alpha/beta hydrolase [Streptomyces sp. 8L]